jgi:outer membrane protein OmpA-like peptidoglycan-associated protein
MTNLLDSVKEMLTDAVMDKASSLIGLDKSTTSSAMGKFLPAIIGGLISKGNTESGAGVLLDLFKSGGFGKNDIDLAGILGDSSKSESFLSQGGDLLGSIFGNNQSSILETLLGVTGINKAGGSMLLKMLAPIVMNKLAGMVFNNNWSASKLSSYLGDQQSSISSLIPGMGNMLGFGSGSTTSNTVSKGTSINSESDGGGSGWLKWLLPLILGLGAIWFLTKDGCGNKAADGDAMTMEGVDSTDMMATTGINAADSGKMTASNNGGNAEYSGLTINANGDLVDKDGNIVFGWKSYSLDGSNNIIGDDGRVLIAAASIPSGLLGQIKSYSGKYSGTKLTLDADGNLVDAAGTVVVKKGDFVEKDGFYYDKQGNKLGRIWGKIIEAIGNAAEKTVDAMKGLFSKMVKKEAGAKTNYTLTNIIFDEGDHRIKGFSKAEVEGLAAALKENADGKIVVQANASDGKNDKGNKELSSKRAQVVHDMLVTLGVNNNQISFEGLGTGENSMMIMAK